MKQITVLPSDLACPAKPYRSGKLWRKGLALIAVAVLCAGPARAGLKSNITDNHAATIANANIQGTLNSASEGCNCNRKSFDKLHAAPPVLPGDITKYGTLSNPTGNPIGGGAGYSKIINSAAATYIVNDKSGLLNALASATSGQIIYVNDNAAIDLSLDASGEPYRNILIPAGVTLASGRGNGTSQGALIYSNQLTYDIIPPDGHGGWFTIGGNGVRITGLRLQGPDTEIGTSEYWRPVGRGIYSEYYVEVDNNEIAGWAHGGVCAYYTNISASAVPYIHHNFIHHNRRYGLGYGISISFGGSAIIEANIFDYNRHSISGCGTPDESYIARYNLVLENGTNHAFDMHGGVDREDGTNIAGKRIDIYGNTFHKITWVPPYAVQYAVVIRGVPTDGAYIHDNYLYYDYSDPDLDWDNPDPNATGANPFQQSECMAYPPYWTCGVYTGAKNFYVYNNCYNGKTESGAVCSQLQPPPAPTLSSPANNATGVSTTPTLVWNAVAATPPVDNYYVAVYTTTGTFVQGAFTGATTTRWTAPTALANSTMYHWYVWAHNSVGYSPQSIDWYFTTAGGSSVIFSDDFNDGNYNGWTVDMSSWKVTGGVLAQNSGGNNKGEIHVTNSSFTNGTIEAQCQHYASDADWGITFRGTNYYNCYAFLFENGYLYLRNAGTNSGTIAYTSFSPATGSWYILKVVVSGTSIKCYRDGNLVFDKTDSKYSSGFYGLHSWADARFDNFKVTSGKSAFEVAGNDSRPLLPAENELLFCAPNPFTGRTAISYQLAATANVSLKVYNISGQLVRTLVDAPMPAGYHSVAWDGRDEQGMKVAAGVYLYRMVSGDYSKTNKMTMLR